MSCMYNNNNIRGGVMKGPRMGAHLIIALLCLGICCGDVTKRENRLLSRRKRYLSYPDGSNFVVSMIAVKGLMMTLPDGLTVNTLTECDLPFKLPSDTRLHRKYKRPMRVRHKRDIFNQLSAAFDGFGFDGIPCVKRMICEAQDYGLLKEKSLVQDLIYAIFSDAQEVGEKFSNYCHNATFSQCDVSFLHTIMEGTFTPEST